MTSTDVPRIEGARRLVRQLSAMDCSPERGPARHADADHPTVEFGNVTLAVGKAHFRHAARALRARLASADAGINQPGARTFSSAASPRNKIEL